MVGVFLGRQIFLMKFSSVEPKVSTTLRTCSSVSPAAFHCTVSLMSRNNVLAPKDKISVDFGRTVLGQLLLKSVDRHGNGL